MSNKDIKETINLEDIEAKDVDRRKFLMGAAGTILATTAAAVALTGCAPACDSDVGNTTTTQDQDSGTGADPIRYVDADVTNPC